MNKHSPAPLDIKFARIKAVNFALRPAPRQESLEALKKRLGPAPGVYSAEPAVLDFSAWNDADFSSNDVGLEAYAEVLKEAGVHLVEVRGHSESLESQAEALGVRYEASSAEHADPVLEANPPSAAENRVTAATAAEHSPQAESAPTAPSPETTPAAHPAIPEFDTSRRTMVIDHPVRSGQKIYAQGADLVVLGQVSAGAEVIADGNVHVYGVLRGRALAGAAGDTQARILSTCFEPELVAVAGYYLTFEGGFPEENRAKPTLIHLDHGSEPPVLRLKAINIR
ncbi:MAG TPA: septum site-determining protein MinC [Limnobacter sp.]|nr:septum site-determining protein MinC [Limnobacter sp.]